MNKTNYIITGIIVTAIAGGTVLLNKDEVVIDSAPQQFTETVKVIHLPDGYVNIVNKDGVGVYLKTDDIQTWLDEPRDNNDAVETLKEITRQAVKSDPTLENTKTIDVNYEKNITTQTK